MQAYWGNAKGVIVSYYNNGGQIFSPNSSKTTLAFQDREISQRNETERLTR